jgi:hypothetical protein
LRRIWTQFRYGTSSGRAEALFRIAFAAVLLIQLLTLRPNIGFFFSTEAAFPVPAELEAWYRPATVQTVFWLWLTSAAALLVGAATRAAAAVCFACCLYFLVLRQAETFHAADWLMPSLAFQLALLPSNRRYALDARWFRFERPAPLWPLRLGQLSVAFFYFTAGTSKLGDSAWRNGKGVFMTFAHPLLSHYDLTTLASLPLLSPALSYAIVAWECAMPLLLWWHRSRPWALASAAVFLTIIDLTLPVGWFAWFCLAALLFFVDEPGMPWPVPQRGVAARNGTARFRELFVPWPGPSRAVATHDGAAKVRRLLVTGFLTFHLACFVWMQLAYGALAAGRYDLGARLMRLPVVGSYGYGIANVRYYALWPAALFYPLRWVYFEAVSENGDRRALAPFDDRGRVHVGWLDSREVREGVLLMRAAQGLPTDAWRRYFTRLAEREQCPREIAAYSVAIAPGTFGTDLRENKRFLMRAGFRCSPDVAVQFLSARER